MVLRYDDPSYVDLQSYVFDPLPTSRSIRLLQLSGNTLHAPSIHCKLVVADYDNAFNILTQATSEDLRRHRSEIQPFTGPAPMRQRHYEWVKNKRIKYEALSWCWGKGDPEHAVIIEKDGIYYKMRVRKDLALALKYLRYSNKVR
jgi:hypothetical protein